ncbi:MAG: tetratricopeptide repeat protein [Planctomycetota bacterium]|jgi:tetratricopeptide (TPR) repeat protein
MKTPGEADPRARDLPGGFGFGADGDAWLDQLRSAEAPLPSQGIGRYELLEEISRGGQGVVYRARDPAGERPVALKRLLAGSMATASMRRRFERELEVASTLEHPNIVSVFGLDIVDGVPILAMEWVEGVEITRWAALGNGARRKPAEIVTAFLKVCEAVTYAHRHGVIHRDLKPSNILVDADGEPHVLDFGLAKMAPPASSGDPSISISNQFVGTLKYASPEQVRARPGKVDVRSDVYSLGVLLYELLTGRFPYEVAEAPVQVAQTIERTEPVRPSAFVAVDRDLEAITLKALAKDRACRYQSADDLARDLRCYLAGEPVTARVPGRLTRLRRAARRHRLAVSFAVTVFVLVVAFGAGAAYLAAQNAEQRNFAVDAHRDAKEEAAKAQAISEFLQAMLASADPMQANDRDITVRQVLGAASDRLEGELAEQPAVEASIRHVIGVTYHSLGHYDEAEPHLHRALQLRRALHGGDNPGVAAAANELGHLMTSLGRYGAAEALLREALRMYRAVHDGEHADVATALNNLSKVVFMKGEHSASEPLWREALAIRQRLLGEEHPLTSSSLANLAGCLHAQGKYDAAEPLYRRTLAVDRALLGDDHVDVGATLHNLAALLRDRGDYAEAEAMCLESLEIKRAALGDDHPNVGFTLNILGTVLFRVGDLAESERGFRMALAVYEKSMEREHPRVATALTGLGRALAAQGGYEEAGAVLREALAIRTKLFGEQHPATAESREALAELHRLRGD